MRVRFIGPAPGALAALALAALAPVALTTGPAEALAPPDAAASRQETRPCSSPQARQFDFWVGEWEVRLPDGRLAGHNTIEKILGGCVLRERYRTPSGYAGESLNIYDASRDVWHQTWVDTGGLLLRLEGGFEDGSMILQGETRGPQGSTLQRIRWSRVDGDPDRIRQLWETSRNGGVSWEVAFDGLYLRLDDSTSG